MSNLIRFLEHAAQGRYGKFHMEAAVSSLDVDPAVRRALAEGDIEALTHSIGGRSAMGCFVFTPD